MKKLIVLLTGLFLSTGIALAEPSTSDCDYDDVKAITFQQAKN